MHTLIAFATQWGSKYGGINSFNTDFLSAFGVAYNRSAQIVCIVASATQEEIDTVRENVNVHLVPLLYPPQGKLLSSAQAQAGIDELKRRNIGFDPDKTVWLGHDRITGAAANAAAKTAGGRSVLIHHMSYDHYESYAENSNTAYKKTQEQAELFQQADLVMAIGPLLRDALTDLLEASKLVHMLIPGLAEISPRSTPKTFTAFLSGRFSDDATRIKQGHLGIAAFAKAHCEARNNGMPDALCNQPKLVLRGVDFEKQAAQSSSHLLLDPETELKKFAEEYAQGVINLQALPYTQDRKTLYADLSAASVALMPSWHEGFGLVAWEAIAAGVPLIISKHSGVYRLLEENHPGTGTGCVHTRRRRSTIFSSGRPGSRGYCSQSHCQ